MPHQPEFQDFHLDTMERANHNAETSNIASIESDSQDKKVKKLYLPLAAAAPLPVGVITQAMRRVYRRVEALVEEVPTKQVPSCSSLKRGRAAEFNNLSEKRRRSQINEKNESIAESNPQLKQD